MLDFEWDDDKAAQNLRKHGIDFKEAAQVFMDPWRCEALDTRRDDREDRFQVIGMAAGRVLFVVYAERGDRIRLVSARKASSQERKSYEDAAGP